MSRESSAQLSIPTSQDAVPYPSSQEAVQGLFKHGAEGFAAEVLGAGGAGGSFVCPFEPAFLIMSEFTAPLLQFMFPGSSAQVDINGITGAAAAADPVITAVDADDKSKGFTVALPVGIAPDGDTVSVMAIGFRDTNNSL